MEGRRPDPPVIGKLANEYLDNERSKSWLTGVRYVFRSRAFAIPLMGSLPGAQSEFVLISDAPLGREPSASECRNELGANVEDNGC
jgi:hypothetical protein